MRSKIIITAALVFIMAIGPAMLPQGPAGTSITAHAFEAPENIEVMIGTVTIDKKDITEDTVVEVPIYMYNNPGFLAFNGIYMIDPNLDFDEDEIESDLPEVQSISIYTCRGGDKVISADIMTRGSHKVTEDGYVADLRIKLSPNTAVGMYPITIADGYDGEYLSILVEDSLDACFWSECFSREISGGILVTDLKHGINADKVSLGDVNADSEIDVEDAVRIINHVNGVKSLNNDEFKRGDIDKNGKVDIEDAVSIIAHVNGVKAIE